MNGRTGVFSARFRLEEKRMGSGTAAADFLKKLSEIQDSETETRLIKMGGSADGALQEVMTGDEPSRGTCRYSGFTPFCGRILAGGEKVTEKEFPDGSRAQTWDDANEFSVAENFSVDFVDGLLIGDDSFPPPACTLLFSCELPWVLPPPLEFCFTDIQSVHPDGISFIDGTWLTFADCVSGENIIAHENGGERPVSIEFFTRARPTRIVFPEKGIFRKIKSLLLLLKVRTAARRGGYEIL